MRKLRAWDEANKIMHNDFQCIKSGNEGNDWINNEYGNKIMDIISCDDCNKQQLEFRDQVYSNIIFHSEVLRDTSQILRISVDKALNR